MSDPYCSSCHELITEGNAYDIPTGSGWRNVCPECWVDSRIGVDDDTCQNCSQLIEGGNPFSRFCDKCLEVN